MEVILREDVQNLGTVGDIVKVKPGFARNYLLPRGLAVIADHRNVHVLEHQKRVVADKREHDRRQGRVHGLLVASSGWVGVGRIPKVPIGQ